MKLILFSISLVALQCTFTDNNNDHDVERAENSLIKKEVGNYDSNGNKVG